MIAEVIRCFCLENWTLCRVLFINRFNNNIFLHVISIWEKSSTVYFLWISFVLCITVSVNNHNSKFVIRVCGLCALSWVTILWQMNLRWVTLLFEFLLSVFIGKEQVSHHCSYIDTSCTRLTREQHGWLGRITRKQWRIL